MASLSWKPWIEPVWVYEYEYEYWFFIKTQKCYDRLWAGFWCFLRILQIVQLFSLRMYYRELALFCCLIMLYISRWTRGLSTQHDNMLQGLSGSCFSEKSLLWSIIAESLCWSGSTTHLLLELSSPCLVCAIASMQLQVITNHHM